MRLIPFDKCLVRAAVEMNTSFKSSSNGFTATPDLSLVLAPMTGAAENYELPVIGECTFSQDRSNLEYKLQHEIEAHPEVVMVIMIVISETTEYRSRQSDEMKAWKVFSAEPECRDFKSFLSLGEPQLPDDSSVIASIRVAGHVWCNISSVEYYVWIKNDAGDNIDTTNHDPEFMAYGVCNFILAPILVA